MRKTNIRIAYLGESHPRVQKLCENAIIRAHNYYMIDEETVLMKFDNIVYLTSLKTFNKYK